MSAGMPGDQELRVSKQGVSVRGKHWLLEGEKGSNLKGVLPKSEVFKIK
jgi:hypothetical protein